MKNFLFIILLLSALFVSAQKYSALPMDSAEWIVESEMFDGDGGPSHFIKNRYFVSGDTIINDTVYFELFEGVNKYSLGFLFQDTTKQQIYLRNYYAYHNEDQLLFDFSLEVDQEFEFYNFGIMTVKMVDSIQINGELRKRIVFNYGIRCGNHFEDFCFIEGIGSNAGLLPENYLGIMASVLTCYKEKQIDIFPINIHEKGCDLSSIIYAVEIKDKILEDVNIFPNPSTDYITIEAENIGQNLITIKLFNSIGKLEFIGSRKMTKINKIDISKLENGLYFMVLSSEDKTFLTQKFIKN